MSHVFVKFITASLHIRHYYCHQGIVYRGAKFKSDGHVNEQDSDEYESEASEMRELVNLRTSDENPSLPTQPRTINTKIEVDRVMSEVANVGTHTGGKNKLMTPHIPTIRLSKTITSKAFTSDDSCQFLPNGSKGCEKRTNAKQKVKQTVSVTQERGRERMEDPSTQSQPNISLDGYTVQMNDHKNDPQAMKDNLYPVSMYWTCYI